MFTFERFVGLRFLKPKRRQILISVITLITVTGVAVGVAALIIVISVLTGFQEVVQEKHLEAFSHMILNSYQPTIKDYDKLIEKVRAVDGVEAVSPYVIGEVMLTSGVKVAGAVIRGVDSRVVGDVTSLKKSMKLGTLESIDKLHLEPQTLGMEDEEESDELYPGILLGDELAANLHAVKGSMLRVVNPLGEQGPMGPVPKMTKFIVAGVFSTGLYQFDAQFAFMSLEEAQKFFGFGDTISGLEIRLSDLWLAPQVSALLEDDLGWPYRTTTWMQMNRNLFAAMKLEKVVMFIIVSLIVFVAALNIFSTIYMMVMDKQKSIAILKTMGASKKRITRMFVMPGLYIAMIGSVAGFILGVGLCLMQMHFKLVKLDASVYMFSELPMKFEILDFAFIAFAAFAFSFIATIVPARIAAKLDPVQVLRYE